METPKEKPIKISFKDEKTKILEKSMPITLDCWLVAMNATISVKFINNELFAGIRKDGKHLFYECSPSYFSEFALLSKNLDSSSLKKIVLDNLILIQDIGYTVAWIEKNQELIWTEKTQEVIELFFIDKRLELTLDENEKIKSPS